MNDVTELVAGYISQLGNADADDACHSLLELGPVALPQIQQAFRVARNRTVKLRLAQVACHSRSIAALPFLHELLGDGDTEIWKTALDGLVYLGWDEATARDEVMEILRAAKQMADTERRDWIKEALDQVPWANRPA
jgi:hypothetical protein